MSAQPHLRVVTEDGEVLDQCPSCVEYEGQVKGLEKDLRAWRARYADLSRDVEHEARKHALWDPAAALFAYWQLQCNHPRAKFNAERFWLVEPFLRDDGDELCRQAIDGAAFDPFTKRRRNGSIKRYDDWELVFRSRTKFEEFANRAPREAAK